MTVVTSVCLCRSAAEDIDSNASESDSEEESKEVNFVTLWYNNNNNINNGYRIMNNHDDIKNIFICIFQMCKYFVDFNKLVMYVSVRNVNAVILI